VFQDDCYSLDNQNCQWQGIDALLELQIPIDGQETVELSGGLFVAVGRSWCPTIA
jgi:hypothetical protein